ncbi:hypothetical protein FB45DRAFT_197586 [Roridomyces roridus]|uniref:Uncharacterized protein n=1 Tax=Roridomyces roridus TaxID=1738132 RepID=A0AAD7FWV5_9AGAR|nr:hypothetical protein FB45DRAFT_197586 [Roridomyces roridus]
MVTGVARRTEDAGNVLDAIQQKVDQSTRNAPDFEAITQELEDIHRRLRTDFPGIFKSLAQIQKTRADTEDKEASAKPAPELLDKLNQVLAILQDEAVQRSMQTNQQTDSVRYLNELNSWLEAFVSGGTAQIQVVAAGVEKLCQELGCSDDGRNSNILAALRQFISEAQAREHSSTALQHSVNNLAALLGSETRFTPETIMGLIDQQRQDHEGLLRALAAELSNEIRGERLRFVDAMKEATAINVQSKWPAIYIWPLTQPRAVHVEQLKAELASQVRADLFTYYSKQKPPPAVCIVSSETTRLTTTLVPPSTNVCSACQNGDSIANTAQP